MRIEASIANPRLQVDQKMAGRVATGDFEDLLARGLEQVHTLQSQADAAVWQLAVGETDGLHNVMSAVERASIALELTIAIRNKLVDAYQELMRMQV